MIPASTVHGVVTVVLGCAGYGAAAGGGVMAAGGGLLARFNVLKREPVPAELAQAGRTLTLQTKISPPFVAEGDSARLGILLSAGGYLRR